MKLPIVRASGFATIEMVGRSELPAPGMFSTMIDGYYRYAVESREITRIDIESSTGEKSRR